MVADWLNTAGVVLCFSAEGRGRATVVLNINVRRHAGVWVMSRMTVILMVRVVDDSLTDKDREQVLIIIIILTCSTTHL